jgi:hypothetical protein
LALQNDQGNKTGLVVALDLPRNFNPVYLRHLEIQKDDYRMAVGTPREHAPAEDIVDGLLTVAHHNDIIGEVVLAQPLECDFYIARIVFGQKDISKRHTFCYFDSIRQDRMLAKVARRVEDGRVMAMVKQFLKSNGDRGVPQGSPLSPLLANLALDDLDHALDRGSDSITCARYLDDMVVLAADIQRGRQWADRALERIREEAKAIGVSLNTEKTRMDTGTRKQAPAKRTNNPNGRRLRGELDAGNPPVQFDVAGAGDGVMEPLIRLARTATAAGQSHHFPPGEAARTRRRKS